MDVVYAERKNKGNPMKTKISIALSIALALSACSSNSEYAAKPQEDVETLAKRIHKEVIVLDTHHDFSNSNFVHDKNYTMRLRSQVNLPKMDEGGLDVSWLIVYTGQRELNDAGYQTAHEQAMKKFDSIHRLTTEIAPDQIELALTSDDVRRILASGKKVAMIGVENGYPVGTDINNVKKFYDLGARYMSLAHNGHSQLADSNTGDKDKIWLHNGLSDLGKEVVAEMNRLGMMIDISHPSKAANMQTMKLSKAPVIASHSSSRAMYDHSRNLDDEELLALKENGGVVQTVAFRSYLNGPKYKAYQEASNAIFTKAAKELNLKLVTRKEYWGLSPEGREQALIDREKIMAHSKDAIAELKLTTPDVSIEDLVDHIDYMVKLIGIDHVGISSDFDGGGGIDGWNDASETFNVTLALVKRGYSQEEIEKLWGGNLLRVLDDVQAVAKALQVK